MPWSFSFFLGGTENFQGGLSAPMYSTKGASLFSAKVGLDFAMSPLKPKPCNIRPDPFSPDLTQNKPHTSPTALVDPFPFSTLTFNSRQLLPNQTFPNFF